MVVSPQKFPPSLFVPQHERLREGILAFRTWLEWQRHGLELVGAGHVVVAVAPFLLRLVVDALELPLVAVVDFQWLRLALGLA